MGLRTKLPAAFLALIAAAIAAISVIYLDRMLRLMAHGLITSADRTSKQIFEQLRVGLSTPGADPAVVVRNDRALQSAIRAALAFDEYVVYVRLLSLDGRSLITPRGEADSEQASFPIGDFQRLTTSPWPLALTPALWSDYVYEQSQPIAINGQPFGFIKVGVSTGLIANQAHRLVWTVLFIALAAMVLTTGVGILASDLLLRPVMALTSSMEQLAAGNATDVNVEIGGGDEFSTLADKFNVLSRRIRAERTQWQSERGHIFDALRSIRDAMILVDNEGILLFANGEAQGLLALQAGGLSEGKPLHVLLGADHPLMQLIGPALAAGTEVHDVAFELGDRFEQRRFLVSIFSLGAARETAGLLVIMRDMEQVQELETVVDQSSHLARLGGLLSGVAHQIRTPLNVMTLQLELLRQDLEAGKQPQPRLQRLSQEIGRLARTIDALMRFMRPEQVKHEDTAINDLLRDVGNQVGQPNVQVEFRLDPAVPVIKADHDLLREALKNMVNNSVEAMPQGGVVTLSSGYGGNETVEIAIADSGVGIPPDVLDRIFNLYFTTKEGGSGLGLTLALRAIDLHGGSVDVQSQVGTGTTFKIHLPAHNGPAPSQDGKG